MAYYIACRSFIHSFIHSSIVKKHTKTCMHDYKRAVENNHLHTNKNNRNTKDLRVIADMHDQIETYTRSKRQNNETAAF